MGADVRFSISGDFPLPHDDLIEGSGFDVGGPSVTRRESIPDTVAPNMRALICGLNPGKVSADAGVSFAKNGNRFWPAALTSGLVSRDRDPDHALLHDRVGFTDLAKRTTPRAEEITANEFRAGATRVERLLRWLRPEVFVMVGLGGWRQAVDRNAVAGWQPEPFGDTPVYLMPNTSGLNAHETESSLAAHLEKAQAGPT